MSKKNPNLTAEQKLVMFEDGTEPPGSSELNNEKRKGQVDQGRDVQIGNRVKLLRLFEIACHVGLVSSFSIPEVLRAIWRLRDKIRISLPNPVLFDPQRDWQNSPIV